MNMLGIFRKFDKELYNKLMEMDALEMFDFIVEGDQELLAKKTKIYNKVLRKKKWTVEYLMERAGNRAMLEMAKETNATVVVVD